jgi:hypothetical protein
MGISRKNNRKRLSNYRSKTLRGGSATGTAAAAAVAAVVPVAEESPYMAVGPDETPLEIAAIRAKFAVEEENTAGGLAGQGESMESAFDNQTIQGLDISVNESCLSDHPFIIQEFGDELIAGVFNVLSYSASSIKPNFKNIPDIHKAIEDGWKEFAEHPMVPPYDFKTFYETWEKSNLQAEGVVADYKGVTGSWPEAGELMNTIITEVLPGNTTAIESSAGLHSDFWDAKTGFFSKSQTGAFGGFKYDVLKMSYPDAADAGPAAAAATTPSLERLPDSEISVDIMNKLVEDDNERDKWSLPAPVAGTQNVKGLSQKIDYLKRMISSFFTHKNPKQLLVCPEFDFIELLKAWSDPDLQTILETHKELTLDKQDTEVEDLGLKCVLVGEWNKFTSKGCHDSVTYASEAVTYIEKIVEEDTRATQRIESAIKVGGSSELTDTLKQAKKKLKTSTKNLADARKELEKATLEVAKIRGNISNFVDIDKFLEARDGVSTPQTNSCRVIFYKGLTLKSATSLITTEKNAKGEPLSLYKLDEIIFHGTEDDPEIVCYSVHAKSTMPLGSKGMDEMLLKVNEMDAFNKVITGKGLSVGEGAPRSVLYLGDFNYPMINSNPIAHIDLPEPVSPDTEEAGEEQKKAIAKYTKDLSQFEKEKQKAEIPLNYGLTPEKAENTNFNFYRHIADTLKLSMSPNAANAGATLKSRVWDFINEQLKKAMNKNDYRKYGTDFIFYNGLTATNLYDIRTVNDMIRWLNKSEESEYLLAPSSWGDVDFPENPETELIIPNKENAHLRRENAYYPYFVMMDALNGLKSNELYETYQKGDLDVNPNVLFGKTGLQSRENRWAAASRTNPNPSLLKKKKKKKKKKNNDEGLYLEISPAVVKELNTAKAARAATPEQARIPNEQEQQKRRESFEASQQAIYDKLRGVGSAKGRLNAVAANSQGFLRRNEYLATSHLEKLMAKGKKQDGYGGWGKSPERWREAIGAARKKRWTDTEILKIIVNAQGLDGMGRNRRETLEAKTAHPPLRVSPPASFYTDGSRQLPEGGFLEPNIDFAAREEAKRRPGYEVPSIPPWSETPSAGQGGGGRRTKRLSRHGSKLLSRRGSKRLSRGGSKLLSRGGTRSRINKKIRRSRKRLLRRR